ncbi:MAG: hypothetical protein JRD89_12320 [Deltaproteobacteria bacterium]|nr:hypothetical protein [Deltaproteobacteria bacterium]
MTDPCGIANGTGTTLSRIAEVTQKTTPAGNFTPLRCNNPGALGPQKTSIESEEVTPDRQDIDFRHGFESVTGDIVCELIGGNADDLIAAAFGGAWQAPTYTGGALTEADGGGTAPIEIITRTTTTWAGDDYRVGDILLLTTDTTNETEVYVTANTASSGVDLEITTVDGENFPAITVVDSIELVGERVDIDNDAMTTFSFERYQSDIDKAFNFQGVGVNTFAIAIQPDVMTQMTFGLLGMAFDATTATEKTLDAATTNSPITSNPSGGFVLVDGATVGHITGINTNLDNGRVGEPEVGTNTASCLQEGTANMTGDIVVWLVDGTWWDRFKNETEFSVVYAAPDPDGNYFNIVLPRCKLTDYTADIGKNGSIPQTVNIKALKDEITGTTASIQGTWRP